MKEKNNQLPFGKHPAPSYTQIKLMDMIMFTLPNNNIFIATISETFRNNTNFTELNLSNRNLGDFALSIAYTFVKNISSKVGLSWVAKERADIDESVSTVSSHPSCKIRSILFEVNPTINLPQWEEPIFETFKDGALADSGINAIDFSRNDLAEDAILICKILGCSRIINLNLSNNKIKGYLSEFIDSFFTVNEYLVNFEVLDLSDNKLSIFNSAYDHPDMHERIHYLYAPFSELKSTQLRHIKELNLKGNITSPIADLELLNNIWFRWSQDVKIYRLGLTHYEYCKDLMKQDIKSLITKEFAHKGENDGDLTFPPPLEQIIVEYAIIETDWSILHMGDLPLGEI